MLHKNFTLDLDTNMLLIFPTCIASSLSTRVTTKKQTTIFCAKIYFVLIPIGFLLQIWNSNAISVLHKVFVKSTLRLGMG